MTCIFQSRGSGFGDKRKHKYTYSCIQYTYTNVYLALEIRENINIHTVVYSNIHVYLALEIRESINMHTRVFKSAYIHVSIHTVAFSFGDKGILLHKNTYTCILHTYMYI